MPLLMINQKKKLDVELSNCKYIILHTLQNVVAHVKQYVVYAYLICRLELIDRVSLQTFLFIKAIQYNC